MAVRRALPAASRAPTLGIDVSAFQGNIDWDRVARALVFNPVTRRRERIRFAVIRSGGGSYVDSRFQYNWREARRVGLTRGCYIGITADSGRAHEPAHYADYLERALNGDYRSGDMPPFLDHEKGRAEYATDAESRNNVAELVQLRDLLARRIGRLAGVYSGAYWQQHVPADVQNALSDAPLWVPDYRPINGFPWDARVPSGWDKWYIRQFTSQGSVDGIVGDVDVNLYDGRALSFRLFIARSHLTGSKAALGLLGLALIAVFAALYIAGKRPLVLGSFT